MVYVNRIVIQLLVLMNFLIWIVVIKLPDGNLHIITCDVGQGDGILITYKDVQIINDGGPDNEILNCLSKHIPFWDRTIELVILSHPQKDHFGGLVEIFKRYKVKNYLYNDLSSSSPEYQLLTKEVGGSGLRSIYPDVGRVIRVGLIYLDIVNPAKGYQNTETNGYSITYLLKYIGFKAIFTGDLSPDVSESLAISGVLGPVQYIKIPHHGSKEGLTENLLKALEPAVATISVGKNNTYGHPSPEIIEMLNKYNVKTFRTDVDGDVEIVTDGKRMWEVDL